MPWVSKEQLDSLLKTEERLKNIEEQIEVYEYAKAEQVAAASELGLQVALLREAIEGFNPESAIATAIENMRFTMRRTK